MVPVREEFLDMVKEEFTAETIKEIVKGEDTNGNELLNWVVTRKVDKKVSHEDPDLYESQVAHGISQFNAPYTQITDKMKMLGIQPLFLQG